MRFLHCEDCRHRQAGSGAEPLKTLQPARAGPNHPLLQQRALPLSLLLLLLPRQARVQPRVQGLLQQLPIQARAAWLRPLQRRRSAPAQDSRTPLSHLLRQHQVRVPPAAPLFAPSRPLRLGLNLPVAWTKVPFTSCVVFTSQDILLSPFQGLLLVYKSLGSFLVCAAMLPVNVGCTSDTGVCFP